MAKIILSLILSVFSVIILKAALPNEDCISEAAQLSPKQANDIVQALNLCGTDSLFYSPDDYNENYYYCDTNHFNVYRLNNKSASDYFLIEITVRTGNEGYHNWIAKREKNRLVIVNFFRGFLECISFSDINYFNLEFSVMTDDGKINFFMTKDNDKYIFNGLKDIIGKRITPKNRASYLAKYSNPSFWKFLEE